MTREEAIKAMQEGRPVIYTGQGSLGRPEVYMDTCGNVSGRLRGSIWSIGVITKIRRTKAVVTAYLPFGNQLVHTSGLQVATSQEVEFARNYTRQRYPNIQWAY